MGLSGAGKTTLAKALAERTGYKWLNADEIRKEYDDWDFSQEGRIRQAARMKLLSEGHESVICDFIAPLEAQRDIFAADYTIWLDTVERSRYSDTDSVFQIPESPDVVVNTKDVDFWTPLILADIRSKSVSEC
jgi:adenylylsulfate kinase